MALLKVVKLINANVSAEGPDGTLKFSGFSDFEFVAGLGTYPEVVVHRNGVLPGLVRYGGPVVSEPLPINMASVEKVEGVVGLFYPAATSRTCSFVYAATFHTYQYLCLTGGFHWPLLISGLPADGLSIEILLSERKK